ncbi:hypothetical protein CLOP_g9913 [Closterium sp. NIES-67]|nr:hypothetical protein CLOP_g9913 [Closterium sp. NIES-67]
MLPGLRSRRLLVANNGDLPSENAPHGMDASILVTGGQVPAGGVQQRIPAGLGTVPQLCGAPGELGLCVVTYNKVEGLMGPLDDIICARFITELINWAGTSHVLRRIADNTRVYLCGHSRGAKVSVLAAAMDPRVLSLGLVDPVDNTIYAPLAPGYPSAVAAMRAGTSAIEHLLADAHPANQGSRSPSPHSSWAGGTPATAPLPPPTTAGSLKRRVTPAGRWCCETRGTSSSWTRRPCCSRRSVGWGGEGRGREKGDKGVYCGVGACDCAPAESGGGAGTWEWVDGIAIAAAGEQARAGVGEQAWGGVDLGASASGGVASENGSSGSSGGSGSSDISSTDGPVADSWSVGPARAMMPAQTPAPALTPLAPLTVEDSLEAPVSDRKDELKGMVTSVAAELAALGGTKFVSRLKI